MRKALYLIIFLFNSLIPITGQPSHHFTQYKTSDGLYQKTIMHMLQDKKGFLWFATWDGIYKFDGYRFENYKNSAKNHDGLNNSRIDLLTEGTSNYLWMISYDKQVYCFDMESNQFLSIPLSNYQAERIITTHNGQAWIITSDKQLIEAQCTPNRKSISAYKFFKKNQLPSEPIHGILEDKNHNLWILAQTGIYKLEFTSRLRYLIRHYPLHNAVYDAAETKNHLFFAASKGRIWQYDKQKQKFNLLSTDIKSNLHFIREVKNKQLILGSSADGILVYHLEKGTITAQFTTQSTPILTNDRIRDIYIDSYYEAWIRTYNTLGVFHLTLTPKSKLEHFTLKDSSGKNIVNSRPEMYICEDIHRNLWVHPSGGGLGYYDRKKHILKPFFNHEHQSGWDSENKVTSIFSDRQGNLWIGSYNNGLEKITFNTNEFHLLQNVPNNNESLENYTRANFQDSHGNIWMGIKDQTIRVYDNQFHFLGFLTQEGFFSKTRKDKFGMAYSFTEDHKGRIWIGTKGKGIFVAEPLPNHRFHLTQYIHTDSIYSLSHNDIYSMCEDKQQKMWIATFGGGVNYIDLKESLTSQTHFIHSGNLLKQYPAQLCNRVRYVTTAPTGEIWIGTTNGVLVIDSTSKQPENITFRHYTYQGPGSKSINNDNIHQIFFSRHSSNIYLATFGGGLNKLTRQANGTFSFENYTTDNRLPANVILALEEDKRGNLWMATEEELCQFNPQKDEVITYTSKDFPTYFKFNEGAASCTQNGYLLFNTFKGALFFHPDSIHPSNYIPPIAFTRFQVGEQVITPSDSAILQKNINETQVIRLTHEQNEYNIQFAALDMKDHENLFYAYKLEGFENNWNYIGQERSANYTNLPQGHYTLKVRSTNSDGIWVNNTRSIDIIVLPSFWETPWAYICYILGILLIIFIASYILFIIYRLKHKVSIEQEIADIKLRFFTNISHELRTPLTLITGPIELLLKNKELPSTVYEQLSTVQRNTNRMLRLVNQILDFRKIENKKMKLQVQQIDLLPFVRQVTENFNQLASEQQINLHIETPPHSVFLWIDIDKMEKIIFNLLSNAFKYTSKGKQITLSIKEYSNTVSISIADQGIGMTESQLKRLFVRFENFQDLQTHPQTSTGIGLSLTKELVEMHHGKISVESHLGIGSRFVVSFLKGKEHFNKDTEFIISDNIITTSDYAVPKANENTIASTTNNQDTLLLVEDNQELRQFMKNIFANDFVILEAANGLEGETIAIDQLPDLIISDIMMPEKDGIALLSDLKNNETTRHIPIILLSAKSAIENKLEGLNCGADDYLTKPFSVDYLKARVRNLIAQRRILQQVYCKTLLPSAEEKEIPASLTPQLSEQEKTFMNKLMECITQNMDNNEFCVEDMAKTLGMSRSVFFRKLKSITGQSPVDFLKQMRMKRAVQLIENENSLNMSEIAYQIGFNDAHYFSKCFKQTYGISPTEYREKFQEKSSANFNQVYSKT